MTTESTPIEAVTLVNLADGAALELFQNELDKVLRNIADPNTEPKQRRTILLEVVFNPDEQREVGEVKVRVSAKLAGVKGANTRVFFGRHKGQLVATEYNPKQAGLFDEKPELRDVSGVGKSGA